MHEVIQARILNKTDEAETELKELFNEKGEILKNQLNFTNSKTSLKNYRTELDFIKNYPFAPYHYTLVQAIFEGIRDAGATGLHLAHGERSMLEAFQMSSIEIAQEEIGQLIPFYSFYSSVEGFLDPAVERIIKQSLDNEGLEPFDNKILQLLFLIRYVEIVSSNIDSLITLCITQIDDDRIALKKQIEASLQRLEMQTLISRNGDLYFFLTNEEREIGREIKNQDISMDAITGKMSKVLYEDVLQDVVSFRYPVNKKDFKFNRLTDGVIFHNNLEHNLNIEVITPLNYDYEGYTQQKCVLNSDGRILIKLRNREDLIKEIREYLQTESYVRKKSDSAAPKKIQEILRDKAHENQQRQQIIVEILKELLDEAEIYTAGQKLSDEKKISVTEAQNYLVKNLFTKLGYLNATADDAVSEVRSVLLADDIGQQNLIEGNEPNANALDEIRKYVNLRTNNNLSLTLEEVSQYFERQPFGWRDWDTVLLTAKLFSAGELTTKIEGGSVSPKDAVEAFTKAGLWKKVSLLKRQTTNTAELAKARDIAHEIFGKLSDSTSEDKLKDFIQEQLEKWREDLRNYQAQSETGMYPGKTEVKKSLQFVNELM
ncbi:MAG: BREX system P-loop protein BrxC, partial [Aridibacter sp.]